MRLTGRPTRMLLVALPLLGGCATAQRDAAMSSLLLVPGLTMRLPSPGELGESIVATQVLTGTYGAQTFSLQLELEWSQTEIVVAALGGFGAAVFTMRFDGERLRTAGNRAVLEGLDVRYVLSDLILTYLDTNRLAALLSGESVEIRDDARHRVILNQGRELIRIAYSEAERWNADVDFHNAERGYSLQIRTITVERG